MHNVLDIYYFITWFTKLNNKIFYFNRIHELQESRQNWRKSHMPYLTQCMKNYYKVYHENYIFFIYGLLYLYPNNFHNLLWDTSYSKFIESCTYDYSFMLNKGLILMGLYYQYNLHMLQIVFQSHSLLG